MSLLAVGSIGLDEVITPQGESGVVVGGAVIYFTWAASYFYNPILMSSIIGGDFPEEELNALRQRRVNTDGIECIPNEKTFYWKGKYHGDVNHRETLITDLNVLAKFNPILPDIYQNAQYVMLGNTSPTLQLSVLNQLKTKPKLIALDTMNFWIDGHREDLDKVLCKIHLLFLNDSELFLLTQEKNVRLAIRKVQAMYNIKYICIKKGEHGAILVYEDKIFICAALLLEDVKDPTGAGDSFAGGVMGHICKYGQQGLSYTIMQEAILCGTAMASFCVENFSNQNLKQLSEEDIVERINSVRGLSVI